MNRLTGWGWVMCGALVLGTGCDGDTSQIEAEVARILGSDYDIPITGQSPAVTVNVTEQVTRFEDEINNRKTQSDDDRRNYLVLKALCETEPDPTNPGVPRDCTVARFPTRVPRFVWPFGCITQDGANPPVFNQPEACTMPLTCQATDQATMEAALAGTFDPQNPPSGNGCVDVGEWLGSVEGFEDMTKIAQATAFDVSDQGSLKDVRQVKKVTITAVIMHFEENSVTYAVPLTRYYVGAPVSEQAAQDAKLLIADGRVSEFGTMPVIDAMFTGARRMELQAEGKGKLSDALRGFKATLAAQAEFEVPPPTEDARVDNCRDPAHLVNNATDYCESFPKPGGQAKVSIEISVVFTVNLSS